MTLVKSWFLRKITMRKKIQLNYFSVVAPSVLRKPVNSLLHGSSRPVLITINASKYSLLNMLNTIGVAIIVQHFKWIETGPVDIIEDTSWKVRRVRTGFYSRVVCIVERTSEWIKPVQSTFHGVFCLLHILLEFTHKINCYRLTRLQLTSLLQR
jgi:hypothetical protein